MPRPKSDMSSRRDKDIFDGAEADEEMENPLATYREPKSETSAIEANKSEMTEDELADLTYAFQAADMDGGGAIDVDEFSLMLEVMGCEIVDDTARVVAVINEAKAGFAEWVKLADAENVAKCQRIWDEYDEDKSGTMDLKEINAVIAKLRDMGCKVQPVSATTMQAMAKRDDGELDFDEFSSWFLKQEGLPDDFSAPTGGTAGGFSSKKEKGKLAKARKAMMKPLSGMTKKVASGPAALLQQSANMVKKTSTAEEGEKDDEEIGRQMMEDADLMFAEFVFMMRAGMLKEFLPGDWRERAEDMRKLREAFDAADVDGNNELELDELEMCVISMNPKAEINPDDIRKVWNVLNPDDRPWIPFEVYVKGMVKIKRDPVLSSVIPMDVPNRFQLLSLLIDTPINKDQEKLIFDKLNALEKVGINMLNAMGTPKQTKEEIGETLKSACDGQLHYLTDDQRKAVNKVHNTVMFQAFLIGTIFNLLVGLNENFLVYYYETDGMNEAYWTCPDPRDWPGNVSLSTCGNTFADDPFEFISVYGRCTAIPTGNVTRGNNTYRAYEDYGGKGGSLELGGTWVKPGEYEPESVMCGDLDCSTYCDMLGSLVKGDAGWLDPVTLEATHAELGMTAQDRLFYFWALNIVGIVVGVVFELGLLVVTAVKAAVQVAAAIDLRLTPLNEDRAFVAAMLVRTAFELPDPEGEVMGVDAAADAGEDGGHILHDILAMAYIKGKVLLTGVIGKQVALRVCNFSTYIWVGPYAGPMLSASLWDTMMCHAIMKNAECQAIGVTTSVSLLLCFFGCLRFCYKPTLNSTLLLSKVEVFNEIMDRFCPLYEDNQSSLSEIARIQILRAVGVAIVKHGSMFPTMEILLRHAVNYLNMKKSKAGSHAVASTGVIDNETAFIEDFKHISLDESRAVLCVHMLCYVLDGSIGFSELSLWKKLTDRVEELYQIEREKYLPGGEGRDEPEELREYIVMKVPHLAGAVNRIPEGCDTEMEELDELAKSVPLPEHATTFDQLIPRVICQKFRQNIPITTHMITATFDPDANMEYLAKSISPDQLFKFSFNEFTYKVMSALTAQV